AQPTSRSSFSRISATLTGLVHGSTVMSGTVGSTAVMRHSGSNRRGAASPFDAPVDEALGARTALERDGATGEAASGGASTIPSGPTSATSATGRSAVVGADQVPASGAAGNSSGARNGSNGQKVIATTRTATPDSTNTNGRARTSQE